MAARIFTNDELIRVPKIELHLHLDCSLSYNAVKEINPGISIETYQSDFIAAAKCKDLADFLRCAPSGINLMQNAAELELVTADLFKQLKAENVIYAEIRFAPLQHTNNGLHPEEVVEIVSQAVDDNSKKYGIKAGLILCTLRHYSEEDSLRTVKLAAKYIDMSPVCGFDIAADEAGFPIDNHISAFELAQNKGIPCTAHAGEAKGPESIWETMQNFKPARIGHGVRSIEDQKLIDYLIENKIHLEICPSCNIQTDIYKNFEDHPINALFQRCVSLSINTDARTLVNITLSEEYQKLLSAFNWSIQELQQCNLNAVNHAFISEAEKLQLAQIINTGYDL